MICMHQEETTINLRGPVYFFPRSYSTYLLNASPESITIISRAPKTSRIRKTNFSISSY